MKDQRELENLRLSLGVSDEDMLELVTAGSQTVEEIKAITGKLSTDEEAALSAARAHKTYLLGKVFPGKTVQLEHNPHRNSYPQQLRYQSAEEWIAMHEALGSLTWLHEDDKRKAIAADTIWVLECSTDTPLQSMAYAASALSLLIDHVKRLNNA